MSGILVVAEHEGGSFKKPVYELLGKARQLGGPVSAVVVGDAPAADLGAFGATTVYQVRGTPAGYDSNAVADALAAAIATADPDVVLAVAGSLGKDALPRVVARLGTGLATECTDLRLDTPPRASGARAQVVGRRPLFAGKLYGDVRVSGRPAVFSVRPNSFPVPEPASGVATVVQLEVATTPKTEVLERKAPSTTAVDLTEAERIVSGGRSLKTKEEFDRLIRPLAATIGATVGASRAASDIGIADHSEQVGQTGKTVNPTLYLAIGISGAIQHLAGMRTSRVIVAVNKDPDAPIFEHATYGIVADLFEVVPKLAEEFRKALS